MKVAARPIRWGMTVPSRVPAGGHAPVAYDFRRPMTLPRDQARLLEMAFDTFTRHWANHLVARLSIPVTGSVVSVELHSYDEYIRSLPAATTMVLSTVEPGRRTAVIQFPLEAALAWVERMLGGPGTGATVPERELTEIEQQLIRELLRRPVEDLNYSFAALAPLQAQFRAIQYSPQFVQAAEAATPVLTARLALRVDDIPLAATVMLPAEGVLTAMRARDREEHRTAAEIAREKADHAALDDAVAQVPVEVAVRMRPVTVHPPQVLDLAVGAVLPLSHPVSRPLDVVVGDRVLAHAAPGSEGSRLAALIVQVKENR